MTREVLEEDNEGNPTVILFTDTPEDVAAARDEAREQAERGAEVARSLATA